MFLLDITQLPSAIGSNAAQTVVYAIPLEFQLFFYGSLLADLLIFAFVFYKLYKDMTSMWSLHRVADHLYELRKLPLSAVKDNKMNFSKEDIHEITTRVAILKRPLGINVPFVLTRSDFAGTVDIDDPRDPLKKKEYIHPEVFAEGLQAAAEKILTTVRVERDKWNILLILVAGVGIGYILAQVLGKSL